MCFDNIYKTSNIKQWSTTTLHDGGRGRPGQRRLVDTTQFNGSRTEVIFMVARPAYHNLLLGVNISYLLIATKARPDQLYWEAPSSKSKEIDTTQQKMSCQTKIYTHADHLCSCNRASVLIH